MCVENKLVINWLNLNLSLASLVACCVVNDQPVGNPKRKV
jgi:hypothetical protein